MPKAEAPNLDAMSIVLYGKPTDTIATVYPFKIDKSTLAFATIEYEHAEIHSGSSYTASKSVDVGNGANFDMSIITPSNTSWLRFL